MTIIAFTRLTMTDQLEFVYAEGVYLAKRKHADQTVILYQLNQLYVEIFYKKYRRIVGCIKCSNKVDILHPYLETISIDDLFI